MLRLVVKPTDSIKNLPIGQLFMFAGDGRQVFMKTTSGYVQLTGTSAGTMFLPEREAPVHPVTGALTLD